MISMGLFQTFFAHIWEIYYRKFERFTKNAVTRSVFELEKCSFFLNGSEFRQKLIRTIIRVLVQHLYAKTSLGYWLRPLRIKVSLQSPVCPPNIFLSSNYRKLALNVFHPNSTIHTLNSKAFTKSFQHLLTKYYRVIANIWLNLHNLNEQTMVPTLMLPIDWLDLTKAPILI